ncbi:MAG: helix-turn-helix transcriptional regulator [Pseudomonadota bacterium]
MVFDASSDGLIFPAIQNLSHIVTGKASAKNHSLFVAPKIALVHTVTMDEQPKNGGFNFLKAWREYRGLSQAQLAEMVGTASNMISYLENGDRALTAKWLRRLAPALDTTPGMLLEHDPNDLDTDIIDIWASIEERDKDRARQVLVAFRKTGTDD